MDCLVVNYKKDNICAVIPIGGKGTRLKKITLDTPKPLFPINGKSTIERCIQEIINKGLIRTLPYMYNDGMDGFFVARVKKVIEVNEKDGKKT